MGKGAGNAPGKHTPLQGLRGQGKRSRTSCTASSHLKVSRGQGRSCPLGRSSLSGSFCTAPDISSSPALASLPTQRLPAEANIVHAAPAVEPEAPASATAYGTDSISPPSSPHATQEAWTTATPVGGTATVAIHRRSHGHHHATPSRRVQRAPSLRQPANRACGHRTLGASPALYKKPLHAHLSWPAVARCAYRDLRPHPVQHAVAAETLQHRRTQ